MKNGSTFLKLAIPVTIALALLISFDSFAQTEPETLTAKNAVYLEFGEVLEDTLSTTARYFIKKGN